MAGATWPHRDAVVDSIAARPAPSQQGLLAKRMLKWLASPNGSGSVVVHRLEVTANMR